MKFVVNSLNNADLKFAGFSFSDTLFKIGGFINVANKFVGFFIL